MRSAEAAGQARRTLTTERIVTDHRYRSSQARTPVVHLDLVMCPRHPLRAENPTKFNESCHIESPDGAGRRRTVRANLPSGLANEDLGLTIRSTNSSRRRPA